MRFDVMTLFPRMLEAAFSESIIYRAREKSIIELNFHNIRDYTLNKQKQVDDAPYGGGFGMVMQAQPIYDCYQAILSILPEKPRVIYMSAQAAVLTQKRALELSKLHYITILCGHYEGVDERILEEIVDEEISIGDFVLTGGEIPAMALIDSVARLVPGVLSDEACYIGESHMNGLLEYPQYTRPAVFRGREVPEILLSGHHANIEKWRMEKSIERTKQRRPDLL